MSSADLSALCFELRISASAFKSSLGGCCTGPKRKKLGLTGKRPSFGFSGLTKNRGSDNNVDVGGLGVSKRSKAPQAERKGRMPLQVLAEKDNPKMDLKADAEMRNSKHKAERSVEDISEQEGLADPEGVVVLDSEDSEEEMTRSSSRRLISRRRLAPQADQNVQIQSLRNHKESRSRKEITMTLNDFRRICLLPQATNNNHERIVAAPRENYQMYVEAFEVDVPTTQSHRIESTQGTHKTTSARRSPNPDVDKGKSSAQ
nr:probable ubiquitin-conjugating enzyme E2 37 [Tanacetum cinerariifolium]